MTPHKDKLIAHLRDTVGGDELRHLLMALEKFLGKLEVQVVGGHEFCIWVGDKSVSLDLTQPLTAIDEETAEKVNQLLGI